MNPLTGGRAPKSARTGRGVVEGIWRGRIVEQYADNWVSIVVPNLLNDQAVRAPCVVGGLTVGSLVLVAAVEGRIDDLVVIAPG